MHKKIENIKRCPSATRYAVPVFVLGIWGVLTLVNFLMLLKYASPIPYVDAWITALRAVLPDLDFSWLWAQQNEHRYPIVKLLAWLSYHTFGDMRPLSFGSVFFASATALGLIVASARLRGRMAWTDAVFPMILLHGLQMVNFIWSIQLFFVAAACLACWCMIYLMFPPERHRACTALLAGLALFLLPLHGVMGLVFAPFFGVAFFLHGVYAWRAVPRDENGIPPKKSVPASALINIAAPVLTAVLCVAVVTVKLNTSQGLPYQESFASWSPVEKFLTTLECAGMCFGTLGNRQPLLFGVVALLLTLPVPGLVFLQWKSRRLPGISALSILLAGMAVWMLPVSIGIGRSSMGGGASRYVILASPVICFVFLALSRLMSGFAAREKQPAEAAAANGDRTGENGRMFVKLMQMSIFTLFCSVLGYHFSLGMEIAKLRHEKTEAIFADVRAGLPLEAVAGRYWDYWGWDESQFAGSLKHMREAGVAPWTELRDADYVSAEILPLENILLRGIRRDAEDPTQFSGSGDGSVMLFRLPRKEHVAAVELTCVITNHDVFSGTLTRWKQPDTEGFFGSLGMQHNRLKMQGRKKPYPMTVWIDAEIDCFEFVPDTRPFDMKLTEIKILRTR